MRGKGERVGGWKGGREEEGRDVREEGVGREQKGEKLDRGGGGRGGRREERWVGEWEGEKEGGGMGEEGRGKSEEGGRRRGQGGRREAGWVREGVAAAGVE